MYILDANVFIEAARRYYALDLVPAFWKALEKHGKAGAVITIDRVEQELVKNQDDLEKWFSGNFKAYIKSSKSSNITTTFGEILTWVMSQQQYTDAAKSEFATVADGWIIAYAKFHNLTIVTHEVLDLKIKRKIPMPNVCNQFDVKYINTFELLRALNVKFN